MVKIKKEILVQGRDKVLETAKFWNRQRLFLAWAFSAAIILSTGLEMIKIFLVGDYLLMGLLLLFVFGLILTLIIGNKLDTAAKEANITYKTLNNELKKQEKEL